MLNQSGGPGYGTAFLDQEAAMELYNTIISKISDILYYPLVVPLFLVFTGVYFTIRSRGIQIRLFGEMFKVVSEKPKDKDGVSSFAALMVSTASRVGTGNIIGVSTALCLGGPGAIFWLWVTALLGGATAFIESTLAQIYKRRDTDGSSYGGPSYYMETALKARWAGIIFAIAIILCYAVGYNMLASYNLQSCFEAFSFYGDHTALIIGIILALLFGFIVLGGGKRLMHVTEFLVPLMGVIFIAVSIIVLIINAGNLGNMFSEIFRSAFDFQSIFAGFFGSCIMWGIKRGLYSNEAGMGSAPNAAATADVSHPAKQGLVQMLSVFIDSLLICSATALMCLSSGVVPTEEIKGAPFVQESMRESLGNFGPVFIAVALSLFAFTTLIGNYFYCEGCLRFIIKEKPGKSLLTVFRLGATLLVFIGAIMSADAVWNTADVVQGIMVVVNIPAILILGRRALVCLEDYVAQRKEGKDPHYIAKDCGIKEETDFWK